MYDAQYIHAVQVHRALCLWAGGYITKESHDNAKLNKGSSILKLRGLDGRLTKMTNFSKDQWDEISALHMRDVTDIQLQKRRVLEGDIRNSVNSIIRKCKSVKMSKGGQGANPLDKKVWGSAYQHQAASSDPDV